MTGRLPQAQQRLEDLDLRLPDPVARDAPEQRVPVVLAQLVVELALGGFQVAVDRLFGLLGQVFRNLLLSAPEEERPEGFRQERPGLLAGFAEAAVGLADLRGLAEHARVEELEQAPQLAKVVLDRRAAEGQAVLRTDQPGRLRRLAARVLDRLGLVEDGVIEAVVLEVDDVSPERAVGGQDDVAVVEVFPGLTAADAGMVEDAELRREASGLLLPVEDERPRHHDQRRRRSAAFLGGGPQLAARLQQGEHLDGLAQAHVVGQAAAETELPEEAEPAQAVALIVAELTPE